jgi:phosphoribosyl-AMP cyclohydrolase
MLIMPMPTRDGRYFECNPPKWKGRPPLKTAGFFIVTVMNLDAMNLDFEKSGGLVTAVIQDHATGRVLMVGYMNHEAFQLTVTTGFVTFYSRSRGKLWLKGESSGHRLVMKSIAVDCDLDAVLVQVESLGPGVCHEGYESCFFRRLEDGQWKVAEERAYDPAEVYPGSAGGKA